MTATAVDRQCLSELAGLPDSSPEVLFEERLKCILRPGDRLMDAGCGLGKFFSLDFAKEIGCRIAGVDLQPALTLNRNVHSRVKADLAKLPFSSETFDVVICRLVVEHLVTPEDVFREFHRVLKPQGRVAILTPNLLHYFGAAAWLTPHWFHIWFNSRIRGFSDEDTFRTYYRANTKSSLTRLLFMVGFDRVEISLVEGAPRVLAFNSVLHYMAKIYQDLVNRCEPLSGFRLNIVAMAYKH